MSRAPGQHLVIYDGICRFCNGAVAFIIARDAKRQFTFTPLQSKYAAEQISVYCPERTGTDTFVLIKNGRAYIWSDAALEICLDLGKLWPWLRVLAVVPAGIRDWFYVRLANRRYQIWGRLKACPVPTPDTRDRFVGVDDPVQTVI